MANQDPDIDEYKQPNVYLTYDNPLIAPETKEK